MRSEIIAKENTDENMKRNLQTRVAIVAGATRGAGRGIAVELGVAGATVYCTGRSVRGKTSGRPESIDETAELVTRAGGKGVAIQVDHTQPDQVEALFKRIASEQEGKLDIVANDIWGGDELTEWNVPFWKHSLEAGLKMLERAVNTHIITSHYAAPLLVSNKRGAIFEITDGKTYDYRGTFFYDLVKVTVMRMAFTMAKELEPYNVAAIAVTPGFLRSEAMLDHFGVTEKDWRKGAKKDKFFAFSETPHYIGRAVVALASDPRIMEKTGQTLATWDLAEEYGFTDIDGTQPNWQRSYEAEMTRNNPKNKGTKA